MFCKYLLFSILFPTPLLSAQKYSCTSMHPRNMFWKTVHFFSYTQIGYSVSLWQGRKRIKVALSGAICDRIQMCATQLANSNFPVSPFFPERKQIILCSVVFYSKWNNTIQEDHASCCGRFCLYTPPHPYFFFLSSKWSFACISWRECRTRATRFSGSKKWWTSFFLVQMPLSA